MKNPPESSFFDVVDLERHWSRSILRGTVIPEIRVTAPAKMPRLLYKSLTSVYPVIRNRTVQRYNSIYGYHSTVYIYYLRYFPSSLRLSNLSVRHPSLSLLYYIPFFLSSFSLSLTLSLSIFLSFLSISISIPHASFSIICLGTG